MKKLLNFIFIVALFYFISINCYASTNTYVRSSNNLRVPADVKVDGNNINNILSTPSVSSSEKIYDYADMFSTEQENKLFDQISDYVRKTKYDCVIVTTRDLLGLNITNYTYNFYDYNDFKDEGVIFVIYENNDKKEIFMGTSGNKNSKVFSIYNQEMINTTLKYLYDNSVSKKNYYEASKHFVMIVDGFYDRSSSGYVVDKDGNIVRDIPFLEIIILSLAISFIIIVIVIGKTYKSNKTKKNNIIDNLDKNTVMIKLKSDKLVDTIVK